ncbi:hypothetical protein SLS61_008424 [Didymella pomorum]
MQPTKPIATPHALRSLSTRQEAPKVDVCASQGSDMIAALAALESRGRDEVAQVKAGNFIFIDVNLEVNVDGQAGTEKDDKAPRKQDATAQQLMLRQVNQALLHDQQANAAQRELDNVLRVAAMEQREREKSTIIVVVTEIKAEADLFKQEALVANRGKQETQTVMVFDPRTLTATEPANAEATDAANGTKPAEVAATKTAEAVLYNARPTHSAIIEDPAALMREALEAALDDRRKDENRRNDEKVNIEVSVDVKILIEKDNGPDNDKDNDKNDDKQAEKDRQEAEKQRAEEQQREQDQKDAAEKQKQEEEKAKAEAEKQKQDEEKAKLEAGKKKLEDEKAKAEAEKKLEEDKARLEADKKQQEQKAKADAEQKAKDEQRKADEERAKAEQQKAEEAKAKQEAEKAKLEAEKTKEHFYTSFSPPTNPRERDSTNPADSRKIHPAQEKLDSMDEHTSEKLAEGLPKRVQLDPAEAVFSCNSDAIFKELVTFPDTFLASRTEETAWKLCGSDDHRLLGYSMYIETENKTNPLYDAAVTQVTTHPDAPIDVVALKASPRPERDGKQVMREANTSNTLTDVMEVIKQRALEPHDFGALDGDLLYKAVYENLRENDSTPWIDNFLI